MSSENMGGKFGAAIKVVIIGAGISGIAAARRLVRLGFQDVTILEASHRIGGRIHTTNMGDGWVETGAQWIHGERDNVVHEYATKHGLICGDDRLSTHELNNVHFHTSDGLRMDNVLCENAFEQMSNALDDIKSGKLTNSTTADDDVKNLERHLEEEVSKEVERRRLSGASAHEHQLRIGLLHWFNKYQCSVDGCDSLAELSPTSFSHYRECDGNQLTNLKNGYSAIVQSLAKDARLIDASRILYGKCVNRIETSLNPAAATTMIRLTCDDGTQYDADHVVLTVSLGVLKHSVDTMFEPPLSAAKRQAIQGIGFGTVNKMFIEFARPFWSSNSSGYNLVWMNDDTAAAGAAEKGASSPKNSSWSKALFGFYTVPFASNILCGWVSGEGARQMETLADDSEVLNVCLDLLHRFTGKADLPKVVNFLRTGWNGNPYTRGSYSYLKSGLSEPKLANDVLAEPIYVKKENGQLCPALLFAGEATHSYYYSTVHGAWETGEREANRIADFHRSSAPPPTSRLHNLPAKL